MKILSVEIMHSEVRGFNDDSDYIISSVVQVHPALCKDSFYSWTGVCRSHCTSGSYLRVGGR